MNRVGEMRGIARYLLLPFDEQRAGLTGYFANDLILVVVDVGLQGGDPILQILLYQLNCVPGHSAVHVIETRPRECLAQRRRYQVRPNEIVARDLGAPGSRGAQKRDAHGARRFRHGDLRAAKAQAVYRDAPAREVGDRHPKVQLEIVDVGILEPGGRSVQDRLADSDHYLRSEQYERDRDERDHYESDEVSRLSRCILLSGLTISPVRVLGAAIKLTIVRLCIPTERDRGFRRMMTTESDDVDR